MFLVAKVKCIYKTLSYFRPPKSITKTRYLTLLFLFGWFGFRYTFSI